MSLTRQDIMDRLVIEPIKPEDVSCVTAIEEAIFPDPWKEADFASLVDREDRGYIVARVDGEVIGGAAYHNIIGEVEITNVELKSEYRGYGISRMILEKLIEAGRSIGGSSYTLEVRVSNSIAIHLYESLGFKSEGVRKNFYSKPTEDALIMWLR